MKHLVVLIALLLFPAGLFSEDIPETTNEPGLFDHLGDNIVYSFFGWPILLHGAAVGSTYYLVNNDIDARVNDYAESRDETASNIFGLPGLAGGGIGPVAVPLVMYITSDNNDEIRGSIAVFQAVTIAFLSNNILKAYTGRRPPGEEEYSGSKSELSREFRFGFLKGGVFNGWPSGHSMVNMAMASALVSYYREKKWLWPVAFGWALYVMASVTFGAQGHVHWLSDAVAGGLMGFGIGWTTGSNFYKDRFSKNKIENNNSLFGNNLDINIYGSRESVIVTVGLNY